MTGFVQKDADRAERIVISRRLREEFEKHCTERCAPLVEALQTVKHKCEWTRSHKDYECIAIIDVALAAYHAAQDAGRGKDA